MPTTAYARPAPFGAESLFRAVVAVERAIRALRARMAAHAARRELSQMTIHELADIGLADATRSRADLDAFTRTLARR